MVEWRGVGDAIRHIAENCGLDATTGKYVVLIEALNLQAGAWTSNCSNQARLSRKVEARTHIRGPMALLIVHLLIWSGLGWAQQPTAPQAIEEQTRRNVAAPCLEPPPLVRWEDYRGPFQKVVGTLATTLERKSAYQQHYKPGTLLCSLEPRDKFVLFLHDSFDPLSFLTAGFNAGLDKAKDNDPTLDRVPKVTPNGFVRARRQTWRRITRTSHIQPYFQRTSLLSIGLW